MPCKRILQTFTVRRWEGAWVCTVETKVWTSDKDSDLRGDEKKSKKFRQILEILKKKPEFTNKSRITIS